MSDHSDIGHRMKAYEQISDTKLMKRTPVIIRIDGKAFHTFTKGMAKPFDIVFTTSMHKTAQYLCENIQGCVFGYTQSDEITLVLIDYQTVTTSAWFDYRVQKVSSVSASMAAKAFNRFFKQYIEDNKYALGDEEYDFYSSKFDQAVFDARCFNLPKEEVANMIYWRQLDAQRNSIQSIGQALFSHEQLQGKNCNEIQEMLFQEKNINWNDQPISYKRGVAVIKETKTLELQVDKLGLDKQKVQQSEWVIDAKMPLIKGENRAYVEDRILYYPEEKDNYTV